MYYLIIPFAQAYYLPNKDRKNLCVLTEALVTRIISEVHGNASEVVATGVEFEHNGTKHFVGASKEVIVSAG